MFLEREVCLRTAVSKTKAASFLAAQLPARAGTAGNTQPRAQFPRLGDSEPVPKKHLLKVERGLLGR